MMGNMLPFEGLKKIFPNIGMQTVGNEMKVTIPIEDVINGLKNNLREDVRPYTEIKATPDGIVMKIDVAGSMLGRLKSMSPNIAVNPRDVEILIPKEDIVNAFGMGEQGINIEYSESGITVTVRLM